MIYRFTIVFMLIFAFVPLTAQVDTAVVDSVALDTLAAAVAGPDAALMPGNAEVLPTPMRDPATPAGWFFLLNCVLLGLLVVKFSIFQIYTRNSWNAWINENLFYQLIREKAPVNFLLILLENLLKVYVISAMVLLALDLFVPDVHFTARMLRDIGAVLIAFYIAKMLFTYLLALLTDQYELLKMMNLNAVIFTSNSVYFLIPLILMAAYLSVPYREYGVYLVIALFILAVILLVFRALRIFLKTHIPFNLQFFLYLCGLEILPYLFLAKVLETKVIH